MTDRERAGRAAQTTAGVIDGQSVKATASKWSDYDAGRKVVGRKRHASVDAEVRLLMVNLATADTAESGGV